MAMHNAVSRGVQAREIDFINTRLNMDTSEMSRLPTDTSITHALSDNTASYVQVIVQKQRRTRLPAASSPVTSPAVPTGDEESPLPATVFLPCSALAALQSACGGVVHGLESGAQPNQCGAGEGQDVPFSHSALVSRKHQRLGLETESTQIIPSKKNFGKLPTGKFTIKSDYSSSDDEADAVEVLQLECVGQALAARGAPGGRGGRVGHMSRRIRRRGSRLLAALLAPPRLLIDLPIALLLQLERCALDVVRGVLVEGAVVAADAVGKPALAAAHNALLAVLTATAGTARGFREVLRPLAGAALDAVEPLARVADSLRLIHIHRVQHIHCRCLAPHTATSV